MNLTKPVKNKVTRQNMKLLKKPILFMIIPKVSLFKVFLCKLEFLFRFYRKIWPRHVLMRSIQKYYLKTQRDQRPGDLVELCELWCYTFHSRCSQPDPLLHPFPLEQQTRTHSKLLHCPHCRQTDRLRFKLLNRSQAI